MGVCYSSNRVDMAMLKSNHAAEGGFVHNSHLIRVSLGLDSYLVVPLAVFLDVHSA